MTNPTGNINPTMLPNPGMVNFPPGMLGAPPLLPTLGTLPGVLPGGFPAPIIPGMMNPLMAGGANPFLRPAGTQPTTTQPTTTSEAVKKVFVKNIPPDVSDTFMELLLKDCGPLIRIPVSFGVCEYEDAEGVMRCLRILNNLELLNNRLQIKPAEKTEIYVKDWKEDKRKEWEEMKRNGEISATEEDFDSYLQRDDKTVLDKILLHIEAFDVNKVRDAKEREEEKKEHARERERDAKKKQLQKDNERAYKKKLSEWLSREENKERERKREREREKDRIRDRQRALERELNYDSDEEKRRGNKDPKRLEERKKNRQREMEEDELDRKRAQQEEMMRLEAENFAPLENILPDGPENIEMEVEAPKVEKPKQRKKFVFSTVPEANEDSQQQDQDGQKMQLEGATQRPSTTDAGGVSFNLSFAKTIKAVIANLNQDMEEEDPLYSRKHKPLSIFDKTQTGMAQSQVMETEKVTQETQAQPAEQITATQAIKLLSNEEIKRELEKIISKIPKAKNELFEFPINWTLLLQSDLTERKIRPWLSQKTKEYIGDEEINFINMILKKLVNKESPKEIIKKVSIVLEDDAEEFVIKMWRMIIFELLKLESNISA
eukprot:CAMPEP_0176468914 /NCGR_PEP_ID=MMETSP0127-20121128/39426_1 /TAXON_ID=938130 /ORGANISM="Platyophrya macrostoma, Strain WH" /LENGTH=603 /DNA_ID=CAMNT_0017862673 /DNA_START=84 /DNA_END=1895 /DNA_ORIENTATION=+